MWMNFRRMGLAKKARYTAIIGVPMLLAVLAIYIWVPKEYDDWVGALHISLAIVIGAIPYRDYKRLMDENQRDLEKTKDSDEQIVLLQIHQHLKQMEIELTKNIGTVIFK
jgi:hypothetical protein